VLLKKLNEKRAGLSTEVDSGIVHHEEVATTQAPGCDRSRNKCEEVPLVVRFSPNVQVEGICWIGEVEEKGEAE
jgi:hypothetical protein